MLILFEQDQLLAGISSLLPAVTKWPGWHRWRCSGMRHWASPAGAIATVTSDGLGRRDSHYQRAWAGSAMSKRQKGDIWKADDSSFCTFHLWTQLRTQIRHRTYGKMDSVKHSGVLDSHKHLGFCLFKILITTTTETKVPSVNLQTYLGKDWDKRSSWNECSEVSKQF